MKLVKKVFIKFLGSAANLFNLKFGLVNQSALGHLIFDTEVNYLERGISRRTPRLLLFLLGSTVNETITNFWREKLGANENVFRLKIYSAMASDNKYGKSILNRELGAGDGSVLDESPPLFSFTKEQSILAHSLLGKLIKDKKKPIILFCLRDNAYYLERQDYSNLNNHHHRNVDALNYLPSISFFLSKGFIVVRMGRVAEKKIQLDHEHFIDLPNNQEFMPGSIGIKNREILELALFEKSRFVVSTGLGLDAAATMFRKRVYLTDYYSTHNLYASKLFPFFLPKGYLDTMSGSLLAASDVFNGHYLSGQTAREFEDVNVSLVNCNSDQILKFSSDIFNFEMKGETPGLSRVAKSHAEWLNNCHFKNRHIPIISNHWMNS